MQQGRCRPPMQGPAALAAPRTIRMAVSTSPSTASASLSTTSRHACGRPTGCRCAPWTRLMCPWWSQLCNLAAGARAGAGANMPLPAAGLPAAASGAGAGAGAAACRLPCCLAARRPRPVEQAAARALHCLRLIGLPAGCACQPGMHARQHGSCEAGCTRAAHGHAAAVAGGAALHAHVTQARRCCYTAGARGCHHSWWVSSQASCHRCSIEQGHGRSILRWQATNKGSTAVRYSCCPQCCGWGRQQRCCGCMCWRVRWHGW
mgnify:CR=1 FL=1